MHFFELENIIEIHQNYGKKSSLKIIVSNAQLFEYEKRNPKLENLLKIILRNYGGTFDQFIPVNESFIAKKTPINNNNQTDKKYVIRSLQQLHRGKIIIYKKATNDSDLQFLVPREDQYVLHHISKNIEFRNKIKIEKAKKLVEFVQNDQICRNIQLSYYFGEKLETKCGNCDVCLRENITQASVDYNTIASKILLLFSDHKIRSVNEIIGEIPVEKSFVIKTLQLLIEKKSLRLTSQNKFEKIQ
jgi:ATP-dependent DNA helicase RecQ